MKLYEITELQKELEREEDAEIVSTLQEMVKIELENKAQNIVATIRNFDTDIDAIDAEIVRLQELKKKVVKWNVFIQFTFFKINNYDYLF